MSLIRIFVSYAHTDLRWVTKGEPFGLIPWLQNHFKRDGVEFWWDNSIAGGTDWETTIFRQIDEAHIAILLLNDDFAASDYILDKELPRIEKRYRAQELVVIPILISRMSSRTRKLINWVFSLQVMPNDYTGLNVLAESSSWPETRGALLDSIDTIIDAYRSGGITTTGYVFGTAVAESETAQTTKSSDGAQRGVLHSADIREPKEKAHSASTKKTHSGSRRNAMISLLGFLLVSLAAAFFYLKPQSGKIQIVEPVASVTPTPSPASAEPKSSFDVAPKQATSVETNENKLSSPSPEDVLKGKLAKAEAFESAMDWPACLQIYAEIVETFPDSEIGRNRIDLFLSTHREALKNPSENEFEALRDPITKAAKLGVISAEMYLAEQLRKTQPKDSFNWYCYAAAKGEMKAMTQVGLMYSNAKGVEKDYSKAFSWFQRASDSGDPTGKTCLAECFLNGTGTVKDEPRGVTLLKEAVAEGNLVAMDNLGHCYEKGIGTNVNPEEAARLFKLASDGGDLDSLGNLGVLYMKGEGVPNDPKKGIDLFEHGANQGSATCMYFLGKCYEAGVGVEPNKLQAASWYSRSAELGNPNALDWCRKNGVIPAAGTDH
jgi:TPR repeat protein